jgi:hypothetical protein
LGLVILSLLKESLQFSRPQRGCHLPNSLVSDIPAGKMANLFLQCTPSNSNSL